MESIVNEIIKIDEMADTKIKDARSQSNEILTNAEKECQKIRNGINSAASKKISQIEQANKSEYESKLSSLKKANDLNKQSMDNFFVSRHDEIENKIFAEIVGE